MPKLRSVLLATALLAAPLAATPALAQGAAPASVAQSEHDKLFALFARSDEESLKRNPLNALFRGDMRYADRLGDFLTDAYNNAERQAAQNELADLAKIDRAKLSATHRIASDVFKYDRESTLKGLTPEILALTQTRPMNHFFGFHTFYPTLASGKTGIPLKTVTDHENNLKRHADYVRLIDRSIARFREGKASGVLETSLTIRNMIEQLDAQLKLAPEESPYWEPVKTLKPEIGVEGEEEARIRLVAAYRKAIVEEIYPANARLRDFLRDEYLPAARDSVGLSQMKDGAKLYAQLIENSTTLLYSAEELHQLGLSEVKRIREGMEQVKTEVGFKGSLSEFFTFIRTDPQFKRKSREEITQRYYAIGKMVDEKIGAYFSVLPKTPLQIRPYEEFREKFEAGGSYQQGTPDGSRPGTFYFNAYDLPSRTTPGEVTLYLHEGAPGHHFQISLAQENDKLPAFMRFGGNTAYVEGWALYAETLGYDMGFYKDPYSRQGTLDDEMLRAMRLVVDTGIHAKGWTRDQAIEFMLANSAMGRTDATAEVERYIAIPSQALAYKVGALKIQALRVEAEKALGKKFDIRAFHDQVLNTGALPLPVLEAKIRAWIKAVKQG
ncbi:DUF885 family protein [Novosphingobium sp.]|uniref:DUF885 domain-containing protein n=1 Tax=Novosphingobium sp. TaxID=1874826 RepID=UPI0022C512CB|nr:DUF885 domain-containing protein [Novosphingobium sp.]MCZ8020094.1 DUF885 domain-containing protein [Novosphingobium sp.]MCZ8035739.1 DUF885 domain-containing protein [Novosphingobium sp.]MCZ8053137.1 DUF885 domain-containing protein [Novosphingobium sp.]MCZ8061134.1 DUF885 domain-containing protein [Novosphingobium sp.]MCZ8230863.1 DUF885 domain-containing protein [Novosphingobium sp.]